MKKKTSIILAALFVLFTFAGCGNSAQNNAQESTKNAEPKEITISVPDGLPAISIAKLMKDKDNIIDGYKVNYKLEKSTESLSTAVMKKESDVAIVPSNMAAIAYNKTNGTYKIAGTTGWGSMYIGTINKEQTPEDLKGKEVYNIGKGLTPDIVTKTILKDKGFDVDNDVNFSYVNGVTELAPVILSGKAEYAVVPEPALSTVQTKNPDFNVMIDLNEEWKTMTDSEYGYPQATIIIKNDLIENDKEFVDKLLEKIKESTEFVYSDKETLAADCETVEISAKKPIIIKSIDRSNIKFVAIKDSYKEYETYFDKLNEFDSSTLGGKVPDENIFMEK